MAHRLATWARFARYDRQGRFTRIFEERYWGDEESVSGLGSRSDQTANIRRELPLLFERFGIGSVFDAPCGDFVWMREVVAATGIDYLGGDIVEGVVELARANAAGLDARFQVHDIVKDPLPDADLFLNRDCLFHLNYNDIFSVFRQFARSSAKYILTTTHIDLPYGNQNIATGDFRALDLFAPPFSLPRETLYEFDDYAPPASPRKMVMYDRDQVRAALAAAGRG